MSRSHLQTRSLGSISVGDELTPLEIPLTRTLIVSTAIASRDYQDVHHDPSLAETRGSPDIFMNILTTNGFVGRFVTDWTGPEAQLRKVDIRLGAPNFPGDTMTLEGSVTDKNEAAGTIEVSLRGRNGIGNHVTGKVVVALPA
ncbi:MAG: MaoC family dehydratase [Deltaproteobacteria bacterium]|nr:MaoC family dehydratase [Deltaproteobacteria bacterium]